MVHLVANPDSVLAGELVHLEDIEQKSPPEIIITRMAAKTGRQHIVHLNRFTKISVPVLQQLGDHLLIILLLPQRADLRELQSPYRLCEQNADQSKQRLYHCESPPLTIS